MGFPDIIGKGTFHERIHGAVIWDAFITLSVSFV